MPLDVLTQKRIRKKASFLRPVSCWYLAAISFNALVNDEAAKTVILLSAAEAAEIEKGRKQLR
ncbi:hypothetical protein [Photobacterium leiognathi]|uniref:hypothetical protein n=1 Tax=Photobacterium leiognathi TaxID=553611 RepID=UPI002737209E|nr:hypothetical protein [Photobacterium leiognathi]